GVAETCSTPGTTAFRLLPLGENPGATRHDGLHHGLLAELDDFDRDGQFLADEFGGSPAWVERFVDYWSGPGSFAEFDPDEREAWLRSSRKMFEEVRETALDEVPHTAYATALAEHPALLMSGASSTLAGRRCAEILAASLAN